MFRFGHLLPQNSHVCQFFPNKSNYLSVIKLVKSTGPTVNCQLEPGGPWRMLVLTLVKMMKFPTIEKIYPNIHSDPTKEWHGTVFASRRPKRASKTLIPWVTPSQDVLPKTLNQTTQKVIVPYVWNGVLWVFQGGVAGHRRLFIFLYHGTCISYGFDK